MNFFNNPEKQPSIVGGACIITCVCVGAGMLGLPTAGSGGWFIWSSIAMIATMIIMTASGCLLLEAYKAYPYRSSFSTVTRDLLGPKVALINNLAVYFVGAILLYAYTTSSGLIIEQYTQANSTLASIIFVLLFSSIVWHSTRFVDRVSVVLLIFIVLSFFFITFGLIGSIKPLYLVENFESTNAKYVLSLLPIALASFGYHHTVSTLRDYYTDEHKAQTAIIYGALISLVIYLIWQASIYGNIPRVNFSEIIAAGGNVEVLIGVIGKELSGRDMLPTVISAFSSAAILSSFIGVGLGVFDFLADAFQFENNKNGRFKTWMVTFVPPLVLSCLFPFGFLTSISYASLFAAIWACIIPAILVKKLRSEQCNEKVKPDNNQDSSWQPSEYSVPGGNFLLIVVALFGFLIIGISLLNSFNLIPQYN